TAGFHKIQEAIEKRVQDFRGVREVGELIANDTICRQVSNREPQLERFAARFDVIVFVSGKKSSNGKALFEVCKRVNPRTYFISEVSEIQDSWFEGAEEIGICGATSTPMWLMEDVASYLNLKQPAS
ncbi:MAG: hypothetical protein RL491_830, partial [Bacteroidota bacterium]